MNGLPLVTIVTPSYNQGRFLEATVLSVIEQDYPHIEYMVYDGGSIDNSVDIIKCYDRKIAYWISKADKGQADAINQGWQHASGSILAYLNSDDVYEPGAVKRIVEYFSDHPEISFVYGNYRIINESGQIQDTLEVPAFDFGKLLLGDFIPQPTVFFKAEVLKEIGYLDSGLSFVMDYEFFLRAALAGYRFGKIPGKPIARFRLWGETKTSTKSEVGLQEEIQILEKCFSDPRLPSSFRQLHDQSIATACMNLGYGFYLAGEMKIALRYLRRAIKIYPRLIVQPRFSEILLKSMLGRRVSHIGRQIRRMTRNLQIISKP